ncbi:substrate-binding periplasmic protein [Algicola sagamiensis]|uniref:substrate-binding periplasmic protein n=1 Tax=Algicola sagamiensis TaxID=163869 RepID=UPI00035D1941|nr:transporter substrate-binding domain-containing protein [Algicola sagamiensis]
MRYSINNRSITIRHICSFFIRITLILCSGQVISSEENEIAKIQITAGEWPPYIGKSLDNQGCVAKLIREVFERENKDVTFHFMTWAKAYQKAKTGAYPITAYWFDSPIRREEMLYSAAHLTMESLYFFYPKYVLFEWQSFDDIAGRNLVLNEGYTYRKDFLDALQKHKVNHTFVSHHDQNLQLLILGLADLTVLSEKPAEHILNQLKAFTRKRLRKHPTPLYATKGYLLFHKNAQGEQLKKTFDKRFELIMKEPGYQEDYIRQCTPL